MTNEKFINWCDKAMAFSFYALIYFLPISIALSEIFTGTAFFFYLLKRGGVFYGFLRSNDQSPKSILDFFGKLGRAFKPVSSVLSFPIVLVLMISLVSTLRSQHLLLSVEGFVGKILQSVFLYFNFIECIRSKKRLKIFMTVFFVSCALICINGLYQKVVGHGFIHEHVFDGRISSSLRHANDFAAYLIVAIPALFFLTFLAGPQKQNEDGQIKDFMDLTQSRVKISCLVLFLIGFLCLGLTYSRGAWVGFIASLILTSLFGLRNRKTIISSSLLIIFFIMIFYPGMPYRKSSEEKSVSSKARSSVIDSSSPQEISSLQSSSSALDDSLRASSVVDESPQFTLRHPEYMKEPVGDRFYMANLRTFLARNNRLGYWRRSFKIIEDYPLFGCGVNTYALIAGRYSHGWGGYPHNSYLQMTAETGLAGIAIFFWMLVVIFRHSFRALKQIKIYSQKMLMYGFLTGLLGFLIHSFFDTNFYSVQLGSLLWIIMGVIVVLPKIEID